MTFKERTKRFNRSIARQFLYAFTWLFRHASYGFVKGFSRFFIFVGYAFIPYQKNVSKESLQIAFPEKSEKEINGIVKDCFSNLGRGMIELIYLMEHPELIKGKAVFEGKEHLDRALSEGKGVILVSAHFGSFPLMLMRLAQEGYKVNAIIRPVRDEVAEKFFSDKRKRLGINTIYAHQRKQCVDTSIRVLRDNQTVFIPLDQHFGSAGGVFVDFFGQQAATATGPVVFAQRTQSPILPVFIVRQPDDTHKIIIDQAITIEEKATDDETVRFNVQKITNVIERYIRQYPQEWSWMHRRWKAKSKHDH